MTAPEVSRYSAAAQTFHWLSALLVLLAWGLGVVGEELPKGGPREIGDFAHQMAGEAIVALLFLRLIWRWLRPPPRAPHEAFRALALIMHAALYALLLAAPLAGLVTLFAGGESLSLLGLYDFASPWARNREMKHYAEGVHETLAHALVLLAALHSAAALFHHFVLRDATLRRMLPRRFG